MAAIMTSGVIFGPDGTLVISPCCCVRNFRLVPPMSTPKMFMPPPKCAQSCLKFPGEPHHPKPERFPYLHGRMRCCESLSAGKGRVADPRNDEYGSSGHFLWL